MRKLLENVALLSLVWTLLLQITSAFHIRSTTQNSPTRIISYQRFRIDGGSVAATAAASSLHMAADYALLFDCDGVIVETEELHRLAYNAAFNTYGLKLEDGTPVEWDVKYYDKLQNTVGGGKPKMRYYFNEEVKQWPTSSKPFKPAPDSKEAQEQLVDLLQDTKTEFYKQLLSDVAKARPGVLQLMDEALADPQLKVGICSAATKAGFEKVVDTLVGSSRLSQLDVVMAGDDVSEKKPHPMIYNMAQQAIGVPAENCVVIEDSLVGLRAARAANMRCIITYTDSTAREDFYAEGADAKVADLSNVKLRDIFGPLRAGSTEILEQLRDSKDSSSSGSSRGSSSEGESEVKRSKLSGWLSSSKPVEEVVIKPQKAQPMGKARPMKKTKPATPPAAAVAKSNTGVSASRVPAGAAAIKPAPAAKAKAAPAAAPAVGVWKEVSASRSASPATTPATATAVKAEGVSSSRGTAPAPAKSVAATVAAKSSSGVSPARVPAGAVAMKATAAVAATKSDKKAEGVSASRGAAAATTAPAVKKSAVVATAASAAAPSQSAVAASADSPQNVPTTAATVATTAVVKPAVKSAAVSSAAATQSTAPAAGAQSQQKKQQSTGTAVLEREPEPQPQQQQQQQQQQKTTAVAAVEVAAEPTKPRFTGWTPNHMISP